MEHASTIDIGTRKRRTGGINEDSVATAIFENHHRQTSRPVGVFVLADGVGGEASGDVASFLATTVIRKRVTEALLGPGTDVLERFSIDAYQQRPPTAADDGADPESSLSGERIRTAIQEGIDAAHQHVQQFARDVGGRPATTVVVGVYVDGRLHYGWVGDSRIYVVNATHGRIQQLTRDHAATNDMLDRGEIDDEVFSRVHKDTTAITNALGGSAHGKPNVDVEFGSTDVFGDDVILLTSDGLIDAYPKITPLRKEYERADDKAPVREKIRETLITDDEIRDAVLEADDLQAGVEELVSLANERGGKDNLSVTLARDREADPSPDSLPARGVVAGSDAEEPPTGRNTAADSESKSDDATGDVSAGPSGDAEDGTATADASDDRDSGETTDGSDDDVERAAITIVGEDTIYEIEHGVTIGRGVKDADDNPSIGLVVDEDTDVERHHTQFEYDDAGYWRVRDVSAAGTYVKKSDDWTRLCSDGGADGGGSESNDTCRLEDGVAITLQDPRETQAVTFQFFNSVERAQNRDE